MGQWHYLMMVLYWKFRNMSLTGTWARYITQLGFFLFNIWFCNWLWIPVNFRLTEFLTMTLVARRRRNCSSFRGGEGMGVDERITERQNLELSGHIFLFQSTVYHRTTDHEAEKKSSTSIVCTELAVGLYRKWGCRHFSFESH